MKKKKALRKTYKSKVVLTPEVEQELRSVATTMVTLWNMAHQQILDWWASNKDKPKEDRKRINAFALNYWLTPTRQANPEIGAVSSDLCQQVVKILMGGFESYWSLLKKKDQRARIPRPKGTPEKPYTGFLTLAWQTGKCSDTHISLPTRNKGRVSVELPDYLRECIKGKQVKFAKLYFKDGAFWLSLVCVSDLPAVPENPRFVRAIDLGAGDVAVSDSDGSDFLIPVRRPEKQTRRAIRHIEARMRLRQRGSRGYNRLAESRRRLWNHSGAQHKDYQRKLADALCEEKVEALVVGKPHTRLGLAQSEDGAGDEHFGAQNTGYMFRQLLFLREKCEERGIRFIEKPDPKRVGEKDRPEAKFNASHSLLREACDEFEITASCQRQKKNFKFVAGKKRKQEMA